MSILIFLILSYILLSVSLYFLFPKASVDGWKGLVPGLNFMEWCKLIGRPTWWAALLLLPIVNIFIFTGMAVDLVRSFNKLKFKHTAAAVIYAPAIFLKMAFDDTVSYDGPTIPKEKAYAEAMHEASANNQKLKLKELMDKNPYKKSSGREWIESIVFAVFAAAFIRMFLIEAYVIPTSSMEGSLNVGDFLFVSKAHYGIRPPMTVAMFPLLHNRIPFLNTESYLESPSLPYKRLTAMEPVQRNSPFVFNWPVGDSIYLTSSRSYSIEQVMRNKERYFSNDPQLRKLVRDKDFITRPMDKKDFYIKRAVAVAGDTLQIINRQIHIDGVPVDPPTFVQFAHNVKFPSGAKLEPEIFDDWKISNEDIQGRITADTYVMILNEEQKEKLKIKYPGIEITVRGNSADPNGLFPHDSKINNAWSVDDYGPIWIPKKGTTVPINADNISLYSRIINVYEDNEFEIRNGSIFINGQKADTYTFKQDYFWAMGDNRHNSEDSRMWGFVPADHIVGKPLFIWFSTKNGSISNGINWDRIFKSANIN